MKQKSVDQYIGAPFTWFTGVVEDVLDPKQMGRVRVRCFGYHSDNKSEIPTDSLPWALVMNPVQSASMSGTGVSATGILQGTWVIGFFRDAMSAQDPIVMGTIPSISQSGSSFKGFSDPAGVNPTRPGEIDTPDEATSNYAKSSSYKNKVELRQQNVPTGNTSATWSNLDVADTLKPSYPLNQVVHTQSGHVYEMDDTPGYERISEQHRSGTYTEIDAKGNKTTIVVGDRYTVVLKGDNIYIKGNANLTIDGDYRTLVKGNHYLEVLKGDNIYIKGNANLTIDGDYRTLVKGNHYLEVLGNKVELIHGATNIVTGSFGLLSNGGVAVTAAGALTAVGETASLNAKTQLTLNGASAASLTAGGKITVGGVTGVWGYGTGNVKVT